MYSYLKLAKLSKQKRLFTTDNNFQDNLVSESEGIMYMEKAAKHGTITAILNVAQAYHLWVTLIEWELFLDQRHEGKISQFLSKQPTVNKLADFIL